MDKENKILNYPLKAHQEDGMFKFSVDTLLIARFPTFTSKIKKVLEVGTNNGIVSLILSEYTKATIDAIEIDEKASKIAKGNFEMNNRQEQISIINDDYLHHDFKNKKYDYIISNPPYFSKESGRTTPNSELKRAMFDDHLPLEEFIKKSSSLLQTKGKLAFIYESKRMDDVIATLTKYKLVAKKIQVVHFTKEKESQIFLIEAIKEGNKGIHFIPPFYVTNKGGDYTDQMKEL
jgi:tRNA1(Val) A37 N6-methylase TrmN6